jgi:thiol-disulfide isomerase/thioredoxin
MKYLLSLFLINLVCFSLFSQSYKIEGTFAGKLNKEVYLIGYKDGEQKVIDTTQTDNNGYFQFEIPENAVPGMYDIFVGPGSMFELVFNDENIRFIATGSDINNKIEFVESEENKVYYNYILTQSKNKYMMQVLQDAIRKYPVDDPFYFVLVKQYNKLRNEIDSIVNTSEKNYPGFLAVKYIKSDHPVLPPAGITEEDEINWLKEHYLDYVDFSDSALINTSILSDRVVGYLQLYQKKGMTKEEVQKAMEPAVDTILEKATLNGDVYAWVMEYLVKGFEAVGFDNLLLYLAENEVADNICEDEKRKEIIDKLEYAKKLAVGAVAPEFKTVDINGDTIDLMKLEADNIVLVFWASWCPHCMNEALPELKKLYDENKGKFQVVAVSVDENIRNVENVVLERSFKWITIAEGKGWDGAIPTEYGITGTPTFFVLDKDKRIISKPRDINDIKIAIGL